MSDEQMKGEIKFVGEMSVLNIKPDDVLVVTTEMLISHDQMKHIEEHIYSTFPNNKVLVLSAGLKLGVLSDNG